MIIYKLRLKKKFLLLKKFFLIFIILLLKQNSAFPEILSYNLIDKGKPYAKIVVPPKSPESIYKSAKLLQTYIAKSTGVILPLSENEKAITQVNNINVYIYVQKRTNDEKNSIKKDILESDGFTIDFSTKKYIKIIGNSFIGTEFGVYEFLERFVGVRWLIPGPLGEHIPKRKDLIIKSSTITQLPVFGSRRFSGFDKEDKASRLWARRNRMKDYIRFHHNLYNIFPIDTYTKTHPHLFPQKKGKPYIPYPNVGWQPCLKEPDAITIAVQNISRYFDNNTLSSTFSLGPNDATSGEGSGYCVSDIEGIKLNTWNYNDISDVYFKWANKVVEKILKKYPQKIFGTLAYRETAMPPKKIMVNKKIIPFLTEDRLRWIDPEVKRKGHKLVESWKSRSQRLGFYDYIYGTPYIIPRIYFHHMADVYKYAARNKIVAVYAEAYPNWGEGPKYYLTLKLFWNPFIDVDNILEDWYKCAVGKLAAPYLSDYFTLWETFWTGTIKKSDWFNQRGIYMPFWSPDYLDVAHISDIKISRQLLEKTLEMAQTELQKARANVFLKAFEYYEATVFSYWGLKNNRFGIKKQYAMQMDQKRYKLVEEFEKDLLLRHPLRFDSGKRFPNLQWNESWINKIFR